MRSGAYILSFSPYNSANVCSRHPFRRSWTPHSCALAARQNLALMTELEQWRSTALKAKVLNRELGARLDIGRLSGNTLQQEKEWVKESCCQFLPHKSCGGRCGAFQCFRVNKSGDPCCLPWFRVITGQKPLLRMKFVPLFMMRFSH